MATSQAQLDAAIAALGTEFQSLAAIVTSINADITKLLQEVQSGQPVDLTQELTAIQADTQALQSAVSSLQADDAQVNPAAEAPVVSGVSPNTGPVAGGTAVVLTGKGFTGATAVNFGTVPGTGITVASDTSLNVTSPAAAAAGEVDVLVTTPAGSSAANATDQFTYQ